MLNELQVIRDKLEEMKPKPVIATDPKSSDDEEETDSESENKSDIMATTGKYFVVKHVFKNVDSDNFQNYLELLYGDNSSIDELTVELHRSSRNVNIFYSKNRRRH